MIMKSMAIPDVIEARLTFLVRSSPKPRVLMPADAAGPSERTGTSSYLPVAIHDARRLTLPPSIDSVGYARVRSPTVVTDFHTPPRRSIEVRAILSLAT